MDFLKVLALFLEHIWLKHNFSQPTTSYISPSKYYNKCLNFKNHLPLQNLTVGMWIMLINTPLLQMVIPNFNLLFIFWFCMSKDRRWKIKEGIIPKALQSPFKYFRFRNTKGCFHCTGKHCNVLCLVAEIIVLLVSKLKEKQLLFSDENWMSCLLANQAFEII